MFRTLIIVAAAVLVFLIIKNRLNGKNLQRQNTQSTKTGIMVKCQRCDTYIPRKEAIISGTNNFCCPQHERDWEKDHSNSD